MTWSVTDIPTRNNMLTQLNSALGTGAKISWQNSSDSELTTTALNASGNPFGNPSGGSMALLGVPLTSGNFSASGVAKVKLQTAGSTTILSGTVAQTSGGDVNMDVLPISGQQFRLDSMSLGMN